MLEVFSTIGLGIQRALNYLGIDDAMRPVLFGRAWSLIAGPVTMILVAQSLTPEEQGFNYTFSSLLALQIFLELGFNQSVVQFSAHEAAHLKLTEDRTLSGPQRHIARLASLFRFFVKWYWGLAIAFLCLVGAIGLWFLSREPHQGINWANPWCLLVIATSLSLAIQPIIYFLTGLNQVAFTNRTAATNAVVLNMVYWVALLCGGRLFASPIGSFAALALISARVILPFFSVWRQLWSCSIATEDRINFKADILPFQGRITFTFLTGYFVFQLFTPACFHFAGAAEAGRFGMTLGLLLTVTSVSQAFVSNKTPLFAKFIATGRGSELRNSFRGAYIRCMALAAIGLGAGVPVLMGLRHFPMFSNRLLDFTTTLILAIALLLQCAGLALTYYVRAFRKEPFISVAWAQAILTPLSILFLGDTLGVEGLCLAYLVSWCVGSPWIFLIFRKFWREKIEQVYAPTEADSCHSHI